MGILGFKSAIVDDIKCGLYSALKKLKPYIEKKC